MDEMIVRPGGPLSGEIPISGAKNSVLKLMVATVRIEHGAAGIGSYAFTATVDGRAIAACYPLAAGAVADALAALRIATGASGDPLPTRALPAL